MKRKLLFLTLSITSFSIGQTPVYQNHFSGTLASTGFTTTNSGISLTNDRNSVPNHAAKLTESHGAFFLDITDHKASLMAEGTITLWYKHAGTGESAFGSDKPLIFLSNGYNSYSEGLSLALSSGKVRIIAYSTQSNGGASTSTVSFPTDGTWNHFALSWKFGSGGYLKGYLNGELVVERTHNHNLPSTTSSAIMFTGFDYYYPRSLYGNIDDIEVYTEALSDVQIHDIYAPCDVSIPDANFKSALLNYTPAIDTNGDGEIQCSEAAAKTGLLNLSNKNIADLTGIEAFVNITTLHCGNNQLTSLDVSENTALKSLSCHQNQLTSLNVSANTVLESLACDNNQLTSLDISSNPLLTVLSCRVNQLTNLNAANGNNVNFTHLGADINTNLSCIQVDNAAYSNANWTSQNGYYKPSWAVWSENCIQILGISELETINQVSVYPNPASSILYVTANEETEITVFNLLGETIMTATVTDQENLLDVSGLTSGVYFIQTTNGATAKFMRE